MRNLHVLLYGNVSTHVYLIHFIFFFFFHLFYQIQLVFSFISSAHE